MSQVMLVNRACQISRVFLIICLFSPVPWVGAAPPKDLVKATLVANVSKIEPGTPFKLGVVFDIKPGWHIYWKNPGDSGMATRITWNLPPGFTAGDLEFPIPRRIEQPGNEVVFAYENQVMLMATITPPKDLLPGQTLMFTAKPVWLVCEAVCIPGKATVELPLKTASRSRPANDQLFQAWEKRLPRSADQQAGVTLEAKPLNLSTGHGHTQIKLSPASDVTIFPAAVDGLQVEIGKPQKTADGLQIPLSAEVLKGQQITAKNLEVLVGPYVIKIPVVGVAGSSAAPVNP